MRRSGSLSMVTCVLVAGLSAGCIERRGTPIGPEIGFGQEVSINPRGVSAVDLLFVIDDSGSMIQEQANLATQIPQLVRDLASPPDRDADGSPDWPAVESLRIAIANTDVGIGSVVYDGANCTPGGDDGRLHGMGLYEWQTGEDPDAFAAEVREVVENIGTTGCAFEQQLEASALALERAAIERDFPREDALLAIIVVTDEEDCSVVDDDAFFSSVDRAAPNVHCTRNAAGLTRVADLAAQLRGDRDPEEVLFAAIIGIPPRLGGAAPADINADPDMSYEEVDLGLGLEPRPACEFIDASGVSLGRAAPARRIVDLAGQLEGSVLHSICTDDFGPAIAAIAASVGERVPGVCLARALPNAVPGDVPCTVTVTLPEDEACASIPGYASTGAAGDLEVCEVAQVVPGSGADGWYYDPADATCPRLAMTDAAVPPLGSAVTAVCFFTVQLELGEPCARASQCLSGWCDRMERVCAPLPEVPGDEDPPTGG